MPPHIIIFLMHRFKVVGISYKKANEAIRGKFSLSSTQQSDLLKSFKDQSIKGFIISTCNRTEIYSLCNSSDIIIDLWNSVTESNNKSLENFTYVMAKDEAINHLFKVGCGLESQILGDFEITNQLKKAFIDAKKNEVTNGYLERIVNTVLQAGKEVRSKTKISNGTTSVSYVAVDYIKKKVENYKDKHVLMYGLGDIGKLTIENLHKHLPSENLAVINRTESKAKQIASKYVVKEFKHEDLNDAIANTDILIVATNALLQLLNVENIKNNAITILDLSIPKNVSADVEALDYVNFMGLDDLSKTINSTLINRKSEVPIALDILDKHIADFKNWDAHQEFAVLTQAFKDEMLTIKTDEINFQKKKLENPNEAHLHAISDRLIQKITTRFVTHLKNSSDDSEKAERIKLIKNMFDL